jgi:sterol desaturase/sphingolipid hydroxylase (fatty acid hydroxylase superfamily)
LFALAIYWVSHKKILGFLGFLFPKEIYTHQSTKIDIYILLLQPIALVLLIYPAGIIATVLIAVMLKAGLNLIAASPNLPFTTSAYVVYNIVWILVYDFAQYIGHYLEHKFPVLWEFHKIHHSAKVLNPATAYRFHPIDYCFVNIVISSLTGIVTAFFSWGYGTDITIMSVFQMHIVLFLFYLIGYNFRHSHIKFVYPKWLQYILICPSQHQIHHSVEPKHWDKNMGYVFAFWDYFFGTLYIAKTEDVYEYGLSKTQDNTYDSLANIYIQPFKNIIDQSKK